MIRIVLAVLALLAAFYGLNALKKASPEQKAQLLRKLVFALFAVVLLVLAVTGRLNWLFAVVGVMFAFLSRMLPELVRYSPYLHRLWQEYMAAKQQYGGQGQGGASKSGMSIQEAYEVLGLKPGASEQEIIDAHRKLMQKIHPDRGGSDYLAAKINMAKKILLKK